MNVEEQGSTENAKRQAEKAQKRSRKPSKFRRLSISRGRYDAVSFLASESFLNVITLAYKNDY